MRNQSIPFLIAILCFLLAQTRLVHSQSPEMNSVPAESPEGLSAVDTDVLSDKPTSGRGGYDSGNDQTIVRKRITFKSDYIPFANGLVTNASTIQAWFLILQEHKFKLNFGFDLPMNYYDVESPISAIFSGLGDIKAPLMGIRGWSDRFTLLARVNPWMPTATNNRSMRVAQTDLATGCLVR